MTPNTSTHARIHIVNSEFDRRWRPGPTSSVSSLGDILCLGSESRRRLAGNLRRKEILFEQGQLDVDYLSNNSRWANAKDSFKDAKDFLPSLYLSRELISHQHRMLDGLHSIASDYMPSMPFFRLLLRPWGTYMYSIDHQDPHLSFDRNTCN